MTDDDTTSFKAIDTESVDYKVSMLLSDMAGRYGIAHVTTAVAAWLDRNASTS